MRFTRNTYRRAHRRAYRAYRAAGHAEWLHQVPAWPLDNLPSHMHLMMCGKIARRAIREGKWNV